MKVPAYSILAVLVILFLTVYFLVVPQRDSISNVIQSSVFGLEDKTNTDTIYKTMNESKLQIVDEVIGTGDPVKTGNVVSVQYRGMFEDGIEFDSSYKRNEPFSFTVGTGSVIRGWDQGILGMRVGGRRKLVVPPELGYGSTGTGGGAIPPNATLVFEIELLEIK